MIKLSKLTDYAVVVLGQMAQDAGKTQTASGISSSTGLPEPTVAKVLKLLTKGGLVTSSRGMNGGYKLLKTPDHINMANVVVALEGPVLLTACVDGGDECCSHSATCSMKGRWDPVNAAMTSALENVSLAQMIGGRS